MPASKGDLLPLRYNRIGTGTPVALVKLPPCTTIKAECEPTKQYAQVSRACSVGTLRIVVVYDSWISIALVPFGLAEGALRTVLDLPLPWLSVTSGHRNLPDCHRDVVHACVLFTFQCTSAISYRTIIRLLLPLRCYTGRCIFQLLVCCYHHEQTQDPLALAIELLAVVMCPLGSSTPISLGADP